MQTCFPNGTSNRLIAIRKFFRKDFTQGRLRFLWRRSRNVSPPVGHPVHVHGDHRRGDILNLLRLRFRKEAGLNGCLHRLLVGGSKSRGRRREGEKAACRRGRHLVVGADKEYTPRFVRTAIRILRRPVETWPLVETGEWPRARRGAPSRWERVSVVPAVASGPYARSLVDRG